MRLAKAGGPSGAPIGGFLVNLAATDRGSPYGGLGASRSRLVSALDGAEAFELHAGPARVLEQPDAQAVVAKERLVQAGWLHDVGRELAQLCAGNDTTDRVGCSSRGRIGSRVAVQDWRAVWGRMGMLVQSQARPTRTQLESLMRAVVRLAADTGRETAQAFDPAWLGILRAVVRSGPVRPAELAQALDLKPTAVARNVRSMAEDQFIEITNDDAGADSTLVSATDAGRAELRQINDIGVDFLGAVIEDWSADDICSLTSLITRLIDDWGRFQRSAARGVRGPEGR